MPGKGKSIGKIGAYNYIEGHINVEGSTQAIRLLNMVGQRSIFTVHQEGHWKWGFNIFLA